MPVKTPPQNTLASDVRKYLNHKLVLAQCSFYYKQASLKQSIQWAYSMVEYLKYKSTSISDRELSIMIKMNKTHLQNLLPSPNNKSYQSSLSNLNKIINHSSATGSL